MFRRYGSRPRSIRDSEYVQDVRYAAGAAHPIRGDNAGFVWSENRPFSFCSTTCKIPNISIDKINYRTPDKIAASRVTLRQRRRAWLAASYSRCQATAINR